MGVRPGEPSPEEFATLPRWAKVAFVARCARRVLPLYSLVCPGATPEEMQAIRDAVELAEQAAQSGWVDVELACDISQAAAGAAFNSYGSIAAIAAKVAAHSTDEHWTAHGAHDCVANAARYSSVLDLLPLIRRDFRVVLEKSRAEKWTDDTPVPPSVFGPLEPVEGLKMIAFHRNQMELTNYFASLEKPKRPALAVPAPLFHHVVDAGFGLAAKASAIGVGLGDRVPPG